MARTLGRPFKKSIGVLGVRRTCSTDGLALERLDLPGGSASPSASISEDLIRTGGGDSISERRTVGPGFNALAKNTVFPIGFLVHVQIGHGGGHAGGGLLFLLGKLDPSLYLGGSGRTA